ncbi:MAG TPA: divalent cation tolerance protein CutA [Candidatus Thalassarchaeaceae archaeon]|jgi:periplasmic divalent cation tolerance protein|nr:divalent cation tolerance protein CutA [Candidatus Thalassarchaeaceae archaeon]MDP7658369.1 divalent cation tolerance protein CutA [Candidatus Thalassarchaeaceae archaeon]HJO42944.1 divalent cation tolerance protein CutA [Candidatus Thalassarchaeaceae archaeon]|tara:strand:+ start:61 stop:375 length:315 start_codon:yes stop_codon:yes gene_type:complete
MADEVWVVQTTLPIEWLEPLVGEWCYNIISQDLAACAQRHSITSMFKWEDEVQSAEEWRIQFKTTFSKKDHLISIITSEHPYDVPMIIAFAAETTSEYAEWANS